MAGTLHDLSNLANAPFDQQVQALRQIFGFTVNDLAQALGVNEKTVRRWESGEDLNPHLQNKRSIESLRTIAESLGDLFEPDMIKVWAERPNPALHGEWPKNFAKRPGGIFLMAQLLGTVGR